MLVVQKYGGTSVGIDRAHPRSREALHRDAARRVTTSSSIVSAMSGETNRLLGLAKQVNDDPPAETSASSTSSRRPASRSRSGLVALAIQKRAARAQSFLGSQVRIITDSAFTRARIQSIDGADDPRRAQAGQDRGDRRLPGHRRRRQHHDARPRRLRHQRRRDRRRAQGRRLRDLHRRRRRLHHRSRTSCPTARKIERISYEEMLELASLGAKVLQIRSVEFGMKYGVPIHVRSSFNENEGTWVVPEEKQMEAVVVSGVTADKDEAKITLHRRARQAGHRRPRSSSRCPTPNIVVDMIVQNIVRRRRAPTSPSRCRARDLQARGRSHPAGAARDGRAGHQDRRRASPRSRSSASACARTPASR